MMIFLVYDDDFFAYNCENDWYTSSALNWIGQIGFCQHFINNRITFPVIAAKDKPRC